MVQKQTKIKKRRRGRPLILAIILLVLLLLLLFGDRLGLGTGLSLLGDEPQDRTLPQINETSANEPVNTEVTPSGRQEIILTITETSIEADGETYTLDAFATYLNDVDPDTLFVISDQQANYQLFKEVEALLQAGKKAYVIED
jgi:hypothetical protein